MECVCSQVKNFTALLCIYNYASTPPPFSNAETKLKENKKKKRKIGAEVVPRKKREKKGESEKVRKRAEFSIWMRWRFPKPLELV